MERLVEAHNKFPKIQLDHPPTLSRKHAGSSSLSLSLSTTGPRAGLAVAPALSTTTVTSSPSGSVPIAVRPIHPRSTETYTQQCPDSSPLSSSGRYLQHNFTLSPLERASRAESSSLFESLHSKRLDVPRTINKSINTPPQSQQPSPKTRLPNHNGEPSFEKRPVNSRPQNDSDTYKYELATGHQRRDALGAVANEHNGSHTHSSYGNYQAIEPSASLQESRRRFMAPSPFEALMEGRDRISSLTSDSTATSPYSEALATPPDSECSEFYAPSLKQPIRSRSFHQQPISLGETSAWPRALDRGHRNRSYNFEGAQTQGSGRKRRAFSGTRMSPANQVRKYFIECLQPNPAT